MADQSEELRQVKERIARERLSLLADTRRLREAVNIPKRIKKSVSAHPLLHVAGGLAVGCLAAVMLKTLFARKKKTGLLEPFYRAGAAAIQPHVVRFVADRFQKRRESVTKP